MSFRTFSYTAIFLLTVSVFSSPFAMAQEESLDELLELDIESLANIEISVASKHAEKISEAPGVITVVTRKEIEQYGGVNLLDIFHRIPSMQVSGGVFLLNNVVSMRGQSNQHYANRILFLINGRPFRDSTAGGWNVPLFTQFPLNNIEQIEVIRGPGSVLYGTGAYSGVVNIITRKADNAEAIEASVTYGSFNHRQLDGRAAYEGDNWSVVAALNKVERGGDALSFIDEGNSADALKSDNDGHGLSLLATIGNFTFQSFTSHIAQDSTTTLQRFPPDKLNIARQFMNAGYTHNLWGSWTADFNLGFNRLELDQLNDAFGESDEDQFLGELTVHGSVLDNLDLMVGGVSEHYDGVAANQDFQDHLHSFYGQLEWKPADWLKLVGGIEMNDSENYKVGYSPRAAAIFTPYQNWGAKLLYGSAFRSPSATEAFFTIPNAITPDTSIAPETIDTLEGQIFYQSGNTNISVTAYRSRIEDIIGRIINPSGPGLLITNTGEQVFEGVEVDGRAVLGGGWSVQGSALIQQSESDTDIKSPTFYPGWMAKIGVTYEADGWSLGAFNSTYGDPEDIRGTAPTVSEVNRQPKGYNLVSANLNVGVNEVAGLHNLPDITFTLHGENLLDEDIDFPDLNRQRVNSVPIDSGRAIYGRLTARF